MIYGFSDLQCGLLGETLTHSNSPFVHSRFADYDYRLYEVQKCDLDAFMTAAPFDCLNVTIPHKIAVLSYLSNLTPVAKAVGAVNTVKKVDGKLIGHNTDVFGFSYLLKHADIDVRGKKVLVLGSGGASRAVIYVLKQNGAKEIVTVSRQGEVTYENVQNHADADIIVNATPVGMFPHADDPLLLSLDWFVQLSAVVDLIYRPLQTRLLAEAEKRHIKTANGLSMLVAQAKESAEFFTGNKIADCEIASVTKELRLANQNIVLIGMPGCGKTAVGSALAKTLNRPFFDVDEVIRDTYQKSAEDMIKKDGVKAFRTAEEAVMKELSKKSGSVISLGGGGVLHEEEMQSLKANGIFVYLDRSLSDLPTKNRPISQATPLSAIYEERAPLYQKYADIICQNDGVECAVTRIIKELS